MGGLAPIQMEVCADSVTILDSGVFSFIRENNVIAYYPVAATIIQYIEKNSQYVAPPEGPNHLGPEPEGPIMTTYDMLRAFRR